MAANSLLDFVADQIVEAIGNGRLLPGQGLYEIEVTKQFSISRVPVREALLVLKSQEVLRSSPRCGTYVIDLAFHSAVYNLAGSPLLLTLCNAMSRHVMILLGLETYGLSDLVGIVEEHVQLRRILLEETAASIADGVVRRVIGPFDSKMIAERNPRNCLWTQQ